MKALIETARKEITIFIAYPEVLRGLKESLIHAKEKCRVKLNIAMTEEVFEKGDPSYLDEIRLLRCSVGQPVDSLGMLISDMKTLITVSDWMDEAALLTQDKNLIRVARDYYDNPSCCTNVRTSSKREN